MTTQTKPRIRLGMLTRAEGQIHEIIHLAETAVLFDNRSGKIHKMGVPSEVAIWTKTYVASLHAAGHPVTTRMAQNATIVVSDFTEDELTRFYSEARSILRDIRVRALPTTPTWHECRVVPVDGVVQAAEAHLSWTAILDGEVFGKYETRITAEESLIAETGAIAPTNPRVFAA